MAHWTFFCFTLLVNCLIFSFSSAQGQNAPVTSKISGLPIVDKLCEDQENADVVFLIDGSSSISQDNFDKILFLLQTIVNTLDIDSGKVRTALVQYSGSFLDSKNILHFNLDRYNNRADVQKAISSVSHLMGFTQTGNALLYTLESVFKSHTRPNAVKILIFISDGGANGKFETQADEMKAFGVNVFSIGVGDINYHTLQVIASDPDEKHVTQFINLSDIQEIITILNDILCPSAVTTAPVSPPSPEPVTQPQVTTTTVSPPSPEPVTQPQVTTAPVSPPSPEPVTQPQVTTAPVSPASPEPVTQPQVTAPAVKECGAEQKADLVFLLDGSTSVTEDNFRKVLTAVQMIVDSLNIGADKVRVALVQYSGSFFGGKNTLHFNLDQYNNPADLHKAISSVSYMRGFTYTGKALDYTLKNVFKTKARPSVAKVLILITDGNANDIITIPAKNVKDFGVTVYSIGVGNVNLDQLKEIASDPDSEHVLMVQNFANLEKILQQLGSNICNEAQV